MQRPGLSKELAPRDYAATWRDQAGEIIATTWGGTCCWFPRLPWRLRITADDFEHVIRCGDCPGCRELDRRRLCERLYRRYSEAGRAASPGPVASPVSRTPIRGPERRALFLIRIYAPVEQHAAIAHKLQRVRGLELEPGFYRLGARSVGLLSREQPRARLAIERMGLVARIQSLKLRRGRRAFNELAAGLMVSREIYGAHRNRFYSRGLPTVEKKSWQVVKLATYRSYQRETAPRARKSAGVVLVPPELWSLGRVNRTALKRDLAKAPSPLVVELITRVANSLGRRASSALDVSARAKPASEIERARNAYRHVAGLEQRARTEAPNPSPDFPPSLRGGYVTSEHSQGELLPKQLSDEQLLSLGRGDLPRWMVRELDRETNLKREQDRKAQRLDRELHAALERLRSKLRS